MYLEDRLAALEERVAELEARLARGTDTVIRIGDTVEEIESGDRGVVTRIAGNRVYSRWNGGQELFVRLDECRKVR
jgi:hypothetical protein